MEVLLDSSFIVSCIRENIDFVSQLESQGFKLLLPREVYQELKDLRTKSKPSDKNAIDVAIEIFDSDKIQKTRLGNDSVDKELIKKGKEGYYIATLDRAIKKEVPKKIVIFEAQKKVGVE